MTNQKELTELQKETWQKMGNLLKTYAQKIKKLEDPLYTIQMHQALSKNKKKEIIAMYKAIQKYNYNLSILGTEFDKGESLTEMERWAVMEVCEHVISEICDFLEKCAPIFNPPSL